MLEIEGWKFVIDEEKSSSVMNCGCRKYGEVKPLNDGGRSTMPLSGIIDDGLIEM